MKYIKVGRKCLKQYELRLVGDSPNYPFYAVVAEIEMMLNREGTINVQEGSCIRNVPIRVHVFDSGKSIIPYELGHRPEELSLWDDERCINPCCDFSKNDKCGLGNSKKCDMNLKSLWKKWVKETEEKDGKEKDY